jgi:hypothetical protein
MNRNIGKTDRLTRLILATLLFDPALQHGLITYRVALTYGVWFEIYRSGTGLGLIGYHIRTGQKNFHHKRHEEINFVSFLVIFLLLGLFLH